jgi:hypothetical protein
LQTNIKVSRFKLLARHSKRNCTLCMIVMRKL